MDWEKELYRENEQPLDTLVDGYSNTSIFRKIAFIGDSLSSGEFETVAPDGKRGSYDLFEYSWGQYIARKNGLTAYNFSKGGMTAKRFNESFAEEMGFWDKSLAAQAYVIALGVNDLGHADWELGSPDDIDPSNYKNNKDTIFGHYGAIISRYREISPDAPFFFVGFPRSTSYNEKKEKMIEGLYKLTEIFPHSYVIDLAKYGPTYDDEFKKRFYLHGHLNPSGYILTARLVDSYIDYIVRHNPDEFRNASLVNLGVNYKFK